MAKNDPFSFAQARHQAATELQPEHIADFQRLVKRLRYGSRFQLLFAEFAEATYRDRLIQQLDRVFADLGQPVARIDLSSQGFADFAALEAELRRLAAGHGAIHLTGVDGWFDEGRWRDFNVRREAIAFNVPVRLVIWLSAESVTRAIVLAPDLWAWRGGVYAFTTLPAGPRAAPQPQNGPVDPRTLAERSCRIAVLRQYLSADPLPDDEIRGLLLDELAGLLASIGDLDEALRIRREEELPVYERLGDVRARAVTLGKIADVLQDRGELDEALRIRREEELPVYERLRSARDLLICRAEIGMNYLARGADGDREKALELLNLALRDAQRLQLPEAWQIAEMIQQV